MQSSPTRKYKDEHGYEYVETSDWWKEVCSVLPCFAQLRWPDYSTKVIEQKIDGKSVVIQLWIGLCQKFLGLRDFPGGIGAEVGIYQRIPGKRPPSSLPFAPKELAAFLLPALAKLSEEEMWWPFPELNAEIYFELINPKTKKEFFHAGPERTYWLNKWMNPESYEKYKKDQSKKVPLFSANYNLKYRINGTSYDWSS